MTYVLITEGYQSLHKLVKVDKKCELNTNILLNIVREYLGENLSEDDQLKLVYFTDSGDKVERGTVIQDDEYIRFMTLDSKDKPDKVYFLRYKIIRKKKKERCFIF